MKLVFAAPLPTPSCTDTLWQWVGTSRLCMQDQQPRVRQNENQNKKSFFFNLEKNLRLLFKLTVCQFINVVGFLLPNTFLE